MNIWVGVLITPKSELTMSLGCCMCVWVCVFHFLLGGVCGGGGVILPPCGLYRGLRNVIYQRLHLMSWMIIHIVAPRLIPANHSFHNFFFCCPSHFQGITLAPVTEISKLQGNVRLQQLYTRQDGTLSRYWPTAWAFPFLWEVNIADVLLSSNSLAHVTRWAEWTPSFLLEFALVCKCKWQKQRVLSQVRWGLRLFYLSLQWRPQRLQRYVRDTAPARDSRDASNAASGEENWVVAIETPSL